jgi:hypothetical protein
MKKFKLPPWTDELEQKVLRALHAALHDERVKFERTTPKCDCGSWMSVVEDSRPNQFYKNICHNSKCPFNKN